MAASLANKKPALGGLEKAQALRSFLTATSDSSPAIMPSSQIGLVGTGVAAAGAAQTVDVVVMSAVQLLKVRGQPVAGCELRSESAAPNQHGRY